MYADLFHDDSLRTVFDRLHDATTQDNALLGLDNPFSAHIFVPLASIVDDVEVNLCSMMCHEFSWYELRVTLFPITVDLTFTSYAQYHLSSLCQTYIDIVDVVFVLVWLWPEVGSLRRFSPRFLRGVSSRCPREVGFEVEGPLEQLLELEHHPLLIVLCNLAL